MTSRRYEQGGVVSFVIVAAVLALLLAGGLWFAKRQTAVTPANVGVSQNSTSSPSTSTDSSQPSNSTSSGGQTSSTSTTSNSSNSAPATSSTSTPSVASTGPSSEDIPSAGPTEILATVVSLAVVSGGIYAFVQSQKRVRLSALK